MTLLHKVRHALRLVKRVRTYVNDDDTYGCDFIEWRCAECDAALSRQHAKDCDMCQMLRNQLRKEALEACARMVEGGEYPLGGFGNPDLISTHRNAIATAIRSMIDGTRKDGDK